MPRLSIEFLAGSSSPSVRVDGEFGGPLVREFVADELRPLSSCEYFLRIFEALPIGATYDHGFGNAIAVCVQDGTACLEHVVASIPAYQLPLPLLLEIVRAWSRALASKPGQFAPQYFEVPA
jgi:hypothetical protein